MIFRFKQNIIDQRKKDIKIYRGLKSLAYNSFKKNRFEKSLIYSRLTASFAFNGNMGIWHDKIIEDLLTSIGKTFKHHDTLNLKKSLPERKYKIAFLASSLRDIGGLSEVLKQWVDIFLEKYDNIAVFLTLNLTPYPNLKGFLKKKKIDIYEISAKTHTERIKKLIELLELNHIETLFLFGHPNDVTIIPVITALSYKPYTIFFNHGDHWFWLGTQIMDLIIEQRQIGAKFSKFLRHVNANQYIVPLTTRLKSQTTNKKSYGVPESSTLSVTIGEFSKITNEYFRVIERILKKFPNHYHLLVTTPPSTLILEKYLPKNVNVKRRFKVIGPIPNLDPIYGVSDFIIDTFPVAGGCVQLEAMANKIPMISFLCKICPIISFLDYFPSNYEYIANNEDELIELSSTLIQNEKIRKKIGDYLYNHFINNFSPPVVKKLLFSIINKEFSYIEPFKIKFNEQGEIKYDKIFYYKNLYNLTIKDYISSQFYLKLFTFWHKINLFFEALKRNEFRSIKSLLFLMKLSIRGRRIREIIRIHNFHS